MMPYPSIPARAPSQGTLCSASAAVEANVESYVLGDRLEAFLKDYASDKSWAELLVLYRPHGRDCLHGVAYRHGVARPPIHEGKLTPELRADIMVDYVAGDAVDDMAIKYRRSRQALWRRVFSHAPAEARRMRRASIRARRANATLDASLEP